MGKELGYLITISGSLALFYYTFWVMVTVTPTQPFIDSNYWLQSCFPDRFWALMIPSMLLLILMGYISSFIGFILIKSYESSKSKTGALNKEF